MLRNGRRIPGKSWGVTRRAWLGSQRFERSAQAAHLRDLPASARPGRPPDRGARARHRGARRGGAVAQARRPAACLRGIATLTALGIAVEVGDFERFGSAEEFMAYVGLVPSERSSGDSRRQGSITKAGNSHLRRLLVEAAWNQPARPQGGYHARPPSARAGPARGRARLALSAAGCRDAASRARRSSSRSPASSQGSSGRPRPTSRSGGAERMKNPSVSSSG